MASYSSVVVITVLMLITLLIVLTFGIWGMIDVVAGNNDKMIMIIRNSLHIIFTVVAIVFLVIASIVAKNQFGQVNIKRIAIGTISILFIALLLTFGAGIGPTIVLIDNVKGECDPKKSLGSNAATVGMAGVGMILIGISIILVALPLFNDQAYQQIYPQSY